jgi:hypothetical protein
MNRDNRRTWREICQEVLKEKDEDRLNALLQELLDALDKREQIRSEGTSAPSTD